MDLLRGYPNTNSESDHCVGKHKIPFDAKTVNFQKEKFDSLGYLNIDSQPQNISLENNGHTVIVHLHYDTDEIPTISGGALKNLGQFRLNFIYWHFLDKSDPKNGYGNITLPAEIHLAFYNIKYSTFLEAAAEKNGVAVIAYNIQVAPFPKTIFDEFTQHLSSIRQTGAVVYLPEGSGFSLSSFLYKDLRYYSVYHGTRLGVACIRDIIWIDFPFVIGVKPDFAQEFQHFLAADFTTLIKPIDDAKTTQAMVIAVVPMTEDEEFSSSIPIIDTIGGYSDSALPAASSDCFATKREQCSG
ncbi:carbonic anhydrase 6-like [Stomoxys calcitrans]|uniref:carbonic anhydrase 6-like n=1 Tax=Stomoxys calcitrans TaxID=35570 RepID=UPI0027E33851|nr:carbonic anhydrase 6-like [Stomoxys calcitrans]